VVRISPFITKSFPQIDGTLHVKGLKSQVEIVSDPMGVPHIYADNDHDLFYVQGYLHAQDRLFQMLLLRAAALGQLGLFVGPDQLITDVGVRLFKFGPVAQEIWDAASSEDRAILQAHADGVNDYIKAAKWEDLPFELLGLGFTNLSKFEDLPWTPIDSIAFARLTTWQLSFDNEGDKGTAFLGIMGGLEAYYTPLLGNPTATTIAGGMTLDLFTPTTPRGTYISLPTTYGTAPPLITGKTINVGKIKALDRVQSLREKLFGSRGMSNSWAVAPANSASGHALLANDPHLSLDNPSVFHESHLNTKKQGGKYNMAGVMFPPDPGVVIGFNEGPGLG
jgi:penicillin amidase